MTAVRFFFLNFPSLNTPLAVNPQKVSLPMVGQTPDPLQMDYSWLWQPLLL